MIADHFITVPTKTDDFFHYQHRETQIVIGHNVWIGARAVLLGGAHIGKGAIVGAATIVDFEVPPYTIAVGNPARILRPGRLKS